ncbi:uncharacterized protein MONOS_15456 [Monocercomonoides exilis]|uniref:uncharacterized protein n=1 Tax=Monocercomonoides exilis TaxID=2049356 RepID=UPI0035599FE0|nr:hypothetical protein MONOS_15456 [Monocercomonoides exilis]|eukprot:MONOS_15456.1-p1 / transcript=MONOS_15456.1 / gene=MONOS_15456 / organism=Monocercomonoides_exilis_PA203 / gene_product=unspecified product / transcript_product=unspecified product / location=Mono_scaffold01237:11997-12755(-) / protein_length=166 / sequence_SO=supercontig / SO=protein_coding / is_pseudo=false
MLSTLSSGLPLNSHALQHSGASSSLMLSMQSAFQSNMSTLVCAGCSIWCVLGRCHQDLDALPAGDLSLLLLSIASLQFAVWLEGEGRTVKGERLGSMQLAVWDHVECPADLAPSRMVRKCFVTIFMADGIFFWRCFLLHLGSHFKGECSARGSWGICVRACGQEG